MEALTASRASCSAENADPLINYLPINFLLINYLLIKFLLMHKIRSRTLCISMKAPCNTVYEIYKKTPSSRLRKNTVICWKGFLFFLGKGAV